MTATETPAAGRADPAALPPGAHAGAVPVRAGGGGWPKWLRRSIIMVVLLACAALLVWGNRHAEVGKVLKDRDPVIVAQLPPPGGRVPQQSEVGAELKQGYDGRLTINGVAIPEEQMEGARNPKTITPDDLRRNGLRPNNHNRVYFTPGKGKVFEKFQTGNLSVSVQYFRDHQSRATGRTITWTITID